MSHYFAKVNWADGAIDAPGVRTSAKLLGQLKGIFRDQAAFAQMDPETVIYRVWWLEPVAHGTVGGLFWGTTEILPGKVGSEYFMTHGHRHAVRDRAEFYGTVTGEGMLVLRDENANVWFEPMAPGSLHYIPGRVAHRTVNTGSTPLRFVACWPSDAGHDYGVIAAQGMGARVVEEGGIAVFMQDGEGL
jgi:glucose-6-phosphate isomerase, archaeal